MKKTKRITILLITAVLLLSVGCNRTDKPDARQPQTAFAPDSLLTPTGDAKLDSLLQAAAIAPQDTDLVKLYYDIGEMYEDNDYEKAKEYYLKAGSLSEELDWNEGRYLYASGFALIITRERLADSALAILQKALDLAEREKNEYQEADMLVSIGNVYTMKGWFETALNYYIKALSFYEKNKSDKLLTLYYQLTQIYCDINAVDKAVEYGEKAVALDNEDVYALSALADAYSSAYRWEEAKACNEQALTLCKAQNNLYLMGFTYYQLADDAWSVFDLKNAEEYASKALDINSQFGRLACFPTLVLLSKIEQLKGRWSKSEEYAREALQIGLEQDILEGMKFCYRILSELAVAQHRYDESVQCWKKIDSLEVAIAQTTTLRAAEEMAAKYETDKKELEIDKQKNIIDRQNRQRWMLAGGIGVCMIVLALLWYMLRLRSRRNRALTERNDTLAEMNATKNKFFSIISHDLKNPAVAQHDAIQLLVDNARLWDADTLSACYHELLKSSKGQVELLYNLLNWAQIQTGRMAYIPATFNLATRLRADITLVRKQAENKRITFTVQMPDDVFVTGDSNMLTTVVRNLLTNAVKFTGQGGAVTLDISPCDATGYTVSVADTGTGMSEEQIRDLFRLDNRHSRPGTANEQGSGLGLIVCKELLEQHGSVLRVESEEGKGSRFWFKAPPSPPERGDVGECG